MRTPVAKKEIKDIYSKEQTSELIHKHQLGETPLFAFLLPEDGKLSIAMSGRMYGFDNILPEKYTMINNAGIFISNLI